MHKATADLRARYLDLRALLTADGVAELSTAAEASVPVSAVTLLSPVPNPDKIICVGLNYATHIKETVREKPKYPSIFTRYPSSVLGHESRLLRPESSETPISKANVHESLQDSRNMATDGRRLIVQQRVALLEAQPTARCRAQDGTASKTS